MSHFYRKENGAWTEQSANALYRKSGGKWSKIDWGDLDESKYRHETLKGKTRYVSLGDSIAVGHRINDDWETDYGWEAQYGYEHPDGTIRTEPTVIIPGCYTDLIRKELTALHGADCVRTASFAQSGDTVADLMEKLSQEPVRDAIEITNYVTICIGANDVLQPALSHLEEYINAGDSALAEIASIVEGNLAVLNNDNAATSYKALFDKLAEINPNAKYVFTTVYNPYKYLWIEEGKNGFFSPVLNAIPQMTILGFEVDELIKDGLLGTDAVEMLFDRINGLCDWAENYVTRLNTVLRNKINSYQAINPNFILADTKAVFDAVPDRPVTAPYHYNDLVNVEYTRGYDTAKMDWGRLWADSDVGSFWWNLATKYVSLSGLDIGGFAADLVAQMIEKVIVPDIDPHPEEYGHHGLYCSFADALGWSALPRRTITFVANGGAGTMAAQTVVALDGYTAYANINAMGFTPGAEGYYFNGWNTKADGSGTAYTNGQFIGLSGDLTLYAQWSNIYTIVYRKVCNNEYQLTPEGQTGPVTKNGSEYYLRATLGGAVLPGLTDAFGSDGKSQTRTITAVYGTELYFQLINTGSYDRGAVYLNGSKVAGNAEYCYHTMPVHHDMTIEFTWEYENGLNGIIPEGQSYWIAYANEYPK